MTTRGFVSLAISIFTVSCMVISQPSPIPTVVQPPTADPTSTQPIFSTPTAIPTITQPIPTPSTGSFELIGHSPLLQRGMNAAITVYGNYAYVGSRTDGSHPDAGVLVVDISNPTNPQVVYQIGPPEEANPGQTSRELRVWPEQELLLVMNFECEAGLHACVETPAPPTINVYDISGANAAAPRLITSYLLPRLPHEFFLWDDPKLAGRALLYISTPGIVGDNLLVVDISQARQGVLLEVSSWNAPGGPRNGTLHSLSVSVDGRRAYLAYLQNGFMIVDTSQLAEGRSNPQIELLTPPENWFEWAGPGPHSAVKLFGEPYVLVTEEVYARCPWDWASILDITDETRPVLVSEYKIDPYNTGEYCTQVSPESYQFTSFTSHNPTLTQNLAFISWHSGGLQAISIENPLQPRQVAAFLPEPLLSVQTEDPALSSGPNKVVMWSYPIIKDGLIYVVDVRNGLYILRYRGPFEGEVVAISFLEGNSNLGEAQLWEIR
ncbi:MAG TPA: hypothetical protein VK897_26925 [Anaerolineales bacterium]|nr:hypothetical protein [Anaerolineales bacterium]